MFIEIKNPVSKKIVFYNKLDDKHDMLYYGKEKNNLVYLM